MSIFKSITSISKINKSNLTKSKNNLSNENQDLLNKCKQSDNKLTRWVFPTVYYSYINYQLAII